MHYSEEVELMPRRRPFTHTPSFTSVHTVFLPLACAHNLSSAPNSPQPQPQTQTTHTSSYTASFWR